MYERTLKPPCVQALENCCNIIYIYCIYILYVYQYDHYEKVYGYVFFWRFSQISLKLHGGNAGCRIGAMEVGQRLEKRQSTKSIGMRIGEYQLGETIGKGGFGCATWMENLEKYQWLKWNDDRVGSNMWFYMALWFGCVGFWPVALLQVWLRTSSFDGNFFEFCILTFRERSTKHWTSRQHTLWPSNRSVLADCRVEISAPQIAYVSSSKTFMVKLDLSTWAGFWFAFHAQQWYSRI